MELNHIKRLTLKQIVLLTKGLKDIGREDMVGFAVAIRVAAFAKKEDWEKYTNLD